MCHTECKDWSEQKKEKKKNCVKLGYSFPVPASHHVINTDLEKNRQTKKMYSNQCNDEMNAAICGEHNWISNLLEKKQNKKKTKYAAP